MYPFIRLKVLEMRQSSSWMHACSQLLDLHRARSHTGDESRHRRSRHLVLRHGEALNRLIGNNAHCRIQDAPVQITNRRAGWPLSYPSRPPQHPKFRPIGPMFSPFGCENLKSLDFLFLRRRNATGRCNLDGPREAGVARDGSRCGRQEDGSVPVHCLYRISPMRTLP